MKFYLDPTHKRPIHSDYIEFLLEKNGFGEIKFVFHSPVIDRLKKIENKTTTNTEEVKRLNENIDKLNDLLFGPQDYAIIARKRELKTTAKGDKTTKKK
jgi:O-antigen chain-terminating methyltransferase